MAATHHQGIEPVVSLQVPGHQSLQVTFLCQVALDADGSQFLSQSQHFWASGK
jgi:hypothetical protein